jgi:hypothetical protein
VEPDPNCLPFFCGIIGLFFIILVFDEFKK